MRMISGAVLIAAAEQAFAHAHLVPFPHDVFVRDILLPASFVLAVTGVGVLLWGLIADRSRL